jgi:hypothetical protein
VIGLVGLAIGMTVLLGLGKLLILKEPDRSSVAVKPMTVDEILEQEHKRDEAIVQVIAVKVFIRQQAEDARK